MCIVTFQRHQRLIQRKKQITLFLDGLFYAIFHFCSLVTPLFFLQERKQWTRWHLPFLLPVTSAPSGWCSSIRSKGMEQLTSVRISLRSWLGSAGCIKLQTCFTAEWGNSSWQQDQPHSLRGFFAINCHRFWSSLADYQIFLWFAFLFCGRVEHSLDTVHSARKLAECSSY